MSTRAHLTLKSPLVGEDATVTVTGLSGSEEISKLFEFTVQALFSQREISPEKLLGKSVTLCIDLPSQEKSRYINGIVTAFSGRELVEPDKKRLYSVTLSPHLWLLKRTSDYKVFQDKSVVDIIKEVLDESPKVPCIYELQGTYKPRAYCVQFGETDFNFIERLLAESGMFYYFVHEEDKHTLIIADDSSKYKDCLQKKVQYAIDQQVIINSVYELDEVISLTDAKWQFGDYDYEKDASLVEKNQTKLNPASTKTWEHYRFPTRGKNPEDLKQFAKIAVDAAEAGFEVLNATSTCAHFTPGHRFTLDDHPIKALNKEFVLTAVQHQIVGDGQSYSYYNKFTCVPHDRTVCSPLQQPKALTRGPQTALVVGPRPGEIHTDKFGRIRIQYYWDRVGKKDDKSSCFVRVAQSLAGNQWGTMYIPRVGMEVVVQFLDGDPDRPLVTGTVYNSTNMPPWALPDNLTKSGILTRSSREGQVAHANELSFDDKKGEEKILFHAEKDFVREVENDDILEIGHDQKQTIKNDRITTINEGHETFVLKKGHRTETLETGNEILSIEKGNRNTALSEGNDILHIDRGDRTITLNTGNDTLTLKTGNQTTKASTGKITLEALQGIVLKCGSNTIKITQQGIEVHGIAVVLEGTASSKIKGPLVDVVANGLVTVKGCMVKIN